MFFETFEPKIDFAVSFGVTSYVSLDDNPEWENVCVSYFAYGAEFTKNTRRKQFTHSRYCSVIVMLCPRFNIRFLFCIKMLFFSSQELVLYI